ncbi:hypothetical protein [Streptomyces canus]|uniref:hypothetical protein n=1 Tax=Streptomyces canus TaxID=58343 RepID=UPI0030E350C3
MTQRPDPRDRTHHPVGHLDLVVVRRWGIGNEQTDYNGTATNTLLQSLADIVASEDPDRLSTYAVRGEDPDNAQSGLHTHATGFNKYYGWYYGSADGDLGAWADNLHTTSPSHRIAMSEYGAGANTTQHALNPPKPSPGGSWHPEEYQSLFHEAAWKQLAARPYIMGLVRLGHVRLRLRRP